MLKQPVGIVKFTNVALIKYKKEGKKFEIACYKNTATDFRAGMYFFFPKSQKPNLDRRCLAIQ